MSLHWYLLFFCLLTGKYSTNNSPDESSNNVNGSNISSAVVDANKKLDEITPLLHQASISSNNSLDQDDETSANAGNSSNRNGAHKSNYRKRVKTKLSRKTA